MERINDYGIPEKVCDYCEERIYDDDELTIDKDKHFHTCCFREKGKPNETHLQ